MNNILQYQAIDMELDKLIKQKNTFEEIELIEKMKGIVKNAQNNSIKLDSEAKKLLDEYNKLKVSYDKQLKAIQSLINQDVNSMDRDQITDNLVKINSISSELFMIERNLNIVITKISTALKEFENNKKTAVIAKNKYKDAKEEYSKKVKELEPVIAKKMQDLKSLESKQDPELFAKYKAYKNDGIFPVYTQLQNGACGYCRMELPKNKLDSLKNSNYIVCEHCRRIIFNK